MWKDKLGTYLIDISKYVLTGVVIASIFKDIDESRWLVYGFGILVAASFLVAGLIISNKKGEK